MNVWTIREVHRAPRITVSNKPKTCLDWLLIIILSQMVQCGLVLHYYYFFYNLPYLTFCSIKETCLNMIRSCLRGKTGWRYKKCFIFWHVNDWWADCRTEDWQIRWRNYFIAAEDLTYTHFSIHKRINNQLMFNIWRDKQLGIN